MSSQRDELVAARTDAILADVDAVEAYAGHFEAQMHAVRLEARVYLGQTRRLLAPLRLLRRPGAILLAVSLIPCALFGFSFATTDMAPVASSGANGLAAVNTTSGRLAAVTPLPGPPGAVSAADGSVWVADPSAGQVSRIDAGTGAKAAQVPVGGEPGAIASGGGAIWVADTAGAAVTRIDPATDRVTRTVTLPWAHPGAITFAAGRVWVAGPAARQLAEINPATGSLERTLPVDLQPSAIAAVGQAIWVAGYDTATVEKLAPATGRVLARVRVGAGPAALAVDGGSLWVASNLGATVSRIDLATSAVTAVIRVGPGPTALVAGRGSVWVAEQDSGTIAQIGLQTDQVTARVGVTGALTSLTISGSTIWAGVRRTAVTAGRDTAAYPAAGWRLPALRAGHPLDPPAGLGSHGAADPPRCPRWDGAYHLRCTMPPHLAGPEAGATRRHPAARRWVPSMKRASVPRRALIVSADIGEGHNSAARALEEAIARVWPGCRVGRLDALAVLGPGWGALARTFYVTQVQRTPRMYEFFFSAMWRHRWYLESTRRGMGWWFGRRMQTPIRAFDPDVIISTYPLASAGLSWLRRRGQLGMPAGAWVAAFCPHPSWLYRDLDITFVMHRRALDVAVRAEPGMRVAVGALPVRDAFAPADQAAARERLGVASDRFVVVVCAGSLGLGRMGRGVAAVLAAGPQVQAVVVCGRNEALRGELAGRAEPQGRLLVLGWTDDMPGWMAAADVVVGNAGGATGLEAVACGRPLVLFDPIAGHGRANAELMAAAGLAKLADSPAELTAAICRLASDSAVRAQRAAAAVVAAGGRRREDDLADLAGR